MFYVYLMRAGEGYYKVGVTKNLIKRVASIQTSNPTKVELVSSKLVELPYSIELKLHQKLVDLASGGGSEWFKLDNSKVIELCIFIQKYPHIELSEKVIIKDLLERQLMWKKSVEKKMDTILNNYQRVFKPVPLADPKKLKVVLTQTQKLEQKVEEDSIIEYKALTIIQSEKKASTSLLQRRLKIGYGRASRLLDKFEELGYVSASDGAKPRIVFSDILPALT